MVVALLALLPLTACDDDGSGAASGGSGGGGAGGMSPVEPGNASFQVRQSVGQLDVWMAEPDTTLELRNAADETLKLGTTDYLGSLVLRGVPPGEGYVLRTVGRTPEEHTGRLRVFSEEDSLPAQDFYGAQQLWPAPATSRPATGRCCRST